MIQKEDQMNAEDKYNATGLVLIIALILFFVLVLPNMKQTVTLTSPTFAMGEDGDLSIVSNNTDVSLSAVSTGYFVIDIDGTKYVAEENENHSFSIPSVKGEIKKVSIPLSEKEVSLNITSEKPIEISETNVMWLFILLLATLTLLFLISIV